MPLPEPCKSSSPAAGILPLGHRTGIPRGFWGASRLSCLWLSPGALVHVIHRPAAALPALEHLQRGDQAEHVPCHQLPQSGFHHPARQLQQLQTAHEQQGLDLRQVRAALRAGRWGDCSLVTKGSPRGAAGAGGWGWYPLFPPCCAPRGFSLPTLALFSPAQVSTVCQHVCCLSPRGEGALRLVPGLQPRRPSPAHHEVAGDQLPLPRRLRPPLRVHLSPSPAGGDGSQVGQAAVGRAGRATCLPALPAPPSLYLFLCK